MVGLSFPDEVEAASFAQKVKNRDISPPATQRNSVVESPGSTTPIQSKESKSVKKNESSGGGFFGFGKKEKSKKGKIDKSMISQPSDFQHVSHVGFNAKTGFSAENIPPEWKIIFAKAGITESQLSDKKTAKFIHKFMTENAGMVPGTSGPKAAPNTAAKRQPPPPPASRGSRAPPRKSLHLTNSPTT